MPATRIIDIATSLGVSISTVSKALSGSHEISDATRKRVRAEAKRLNYRPNGAARRLRSGSTRAVGLLSHDSVGRLSLPVLLGAEAAVGMERMSILLCDSRGDAIRGQYHIQTLLEHGIDGLISLAGDTNDQPSLGDVGVPIVYAYGASTDPADFSLVPDEAEGARAAMDLLIGTGRCRIAHVTGPRSYVATRRRMEAWAQSLHEAGLSAPAPPLQGEWTEVWGYAACDMLMRRNPEIDAIFCGSDILARGVQDCLRDHGKRVPADIAVIGFDNWEVIATGARPPLTTIDMCLEDLGRQAVAALLAAIEGNKMSGLRLSPPRLIVRNST